MTKDTFNKEKKAAKSQAHSPIRWRPYSAAL